jgi:nucleoid-associated protein YgaU
MKRFFLTLLVVIGAVATAGAQDPGAEQDAIAERQKILKAADQLELLAQQSAQLAQEVAGLKERVAKLEAANGELRLQLAQQQKDAAAERDKLLKEVSKIVAADGGKPARPAETGGTAAGAGQEAGFEYVVQQGQSLWAIADAYQKAGVNVTVEDIRKANNLGKDEVLKVGQKLFIPKK